jgi:hypothetical protein
MSSTRPSSFRTTGRPTATSRFPAVCAGKSQNHIADHDDWAPRVSFAYALDGHKDKKQAKTVLRGGYGVFYDRFQIANLLSVRALQRRSQQPEAGHHQQSHLLQLHQPEQSRIWPVRLTSSSTSTIDTVKPHFHAP